MYFNINKSKIFFVAFYFIVPVAFHLLFVNLAKYNYPMADDNRIIGEFFFDFYKSNTLGDKIHAIFKLENEGSPALIRLIYLISFVITGNIQYKSIGILANLMAFIPLWIFYDLYKNSKKNILYLLPIPYILLLVVSFYTFYFSYETVFYISSSVIPILIFYLFIVKKQKIGSYLLLLVLLFSSSVVVPTSFIIFIYAIYTKSKRDAFLAILFPVLYYFITRILLKAPPRAVSNEEAFSIKLAVENFYTISKLFFIRIGSWTLIFFKGKIYLSLIAGIVNVVLLFALFWKVLRKVDNILLFFFSSFVSLLSLIFLNVWFRWGSDQNRYLEYVMAFEKSFFIFLYISLFLSFAFFYFNNKKLKIVSFALFALTLATYSFQYYYSYSIWVSWYKTSLLSSLNRHWVGEKEVAIRRNNTDIRSYNSLIKDGFCKPEENIFTDNKIVIENFIASNKEVKKYDLEQLQYSSSGNGKSLVLYSFKNEFQGNSLNRLDGVYMLFENSLDKYILPARFMPSNPVKLLTKKAYYANWMVLEIANVFEDELKESNYNIYILTVNKGNLSTIFKADKVLIKEENRYILKNI